MDHFTVEPVAELPEQPSIQYFEFAPDIQIAYEVRGSSGPPLVFLHGFGASRESWHDIAPFLERHARLYFVDLMGFGLSSKPRRTEYSIALQARIVANFILCLGLTDVTLIGHSYGGGVALRTYLDHHGLPIKTLVLIDAAGYQQPLPFFVGTLRIPIVNRLVLTAIPAGIRARVTLNHLFFNRDRVTRERVHRYAKYFDLRGAHASYIAAARYVVPADHKAVLSRIKSISIPVLILWGDNDAAINVANAHRFARDIIGSKLHIFARCGHIPHEEWPERVADVLLPLISNENE